MAIKLLDIIDTMPILDEIYDNEETKVSKENNYILNEVIELAIRDIDDELLDEANLFKPNSFKVKGEKKAVKFGIEVDGSGSTDRGFDKDPYFKFYVKGKDSVNAGVDNLTRIAILNPEYSSHNTKSNGKYILNSADKKLLNKVMSAPIDAEDSKDYKLYPKCAQSKDPKYSEEDKKERPVSNVWELILYFANKEGKVKFGDSNYLYIDTPMPDYTKL